jgi:hypothetical protein
MGGERVQYSTKSAGEAAFALFRKACDLLHSLIPNSCAAIQRYHTAAKTTHSTDSICCLA